MVLRWSMVRTMDRTPPGMFCPFIFIFYKICYSSIAGSSTRLLVINIFRFSLSAAVIGLQSEGYSQTFAVIELQSDGYK